LCGNKQAFIYLLFIYDYLEESLLDSDELDCFVLPDPVHNLQLRDVLLPLRLPQPAERRTPIFPNYKFVILVQGGQPVPEQYYYAP
jgi:hypothetical protein